MKTFDNKEEQINTETVRENQSKEIFKEVIKEEVIKEDIREKILNSACELMVHKGIKETTLKDIADAVCISKGTLYYYYAAKEDIIYDIADSHLSRITTELLKWIDEIDDALTPEKILTTVFDKILAAETRGKLNLYLVGNAITNNPSLKIKFAEKYKEWQETIQLGLGKIHKVHNNAFKESDSYAMSVLILAILDGLIIQRLVGTSQIDTSDIVRLMYQG